MKTENINKIDPCYAFRSNDDLRYWLFENIELLEEASSTELALVNYNPDFPSIVRPDLCATESETGYRIAVITNLDNITDSDFIRVFSVASLNDIKKVIWIISDLDKVKHYILEWLNDRTQGNVEFIVLKLSTYEMPDSRIGAKLERLEKLPVPSVYEDLI